MGYRPLVHSLSIGLVSRNLRQRAEARPTGRAVSKERLGDWDRPTMVPRVPANTKACHMAKRRVGIWYSPSYAGALAPRGGVTRQGVVLTDLQSLLDCQ
jgi:hypothetical protein